MREWLRRACLFQKMQTQRSGKASDVDAVSQQFSYVQWRKSGQAKAREATLVDADGASSARAFQLAAAVACSGQLLVSSCDANVSLASCVSRRPSHAGGHVAFAQAAAQKKQGYDGRERRPRAQRPMMSGLCLKGAAEVAEVRLALGRVSWRLKPWRCYLAPPL